MSALAVLLFVALSCAAPRPAAPLPSGLSQAAVLPTPSAPIVLLHGLLATAEAMTHIMAWISADFANATMVNVAITPDKISTLLVDINIQVDLFAATLKKDARLVHGAHFVCHSQGCMIMRAYIERFSGRNGHPVCINLVSLAGPHDGVYGVPDLNFYCPDKTPECDFLENIFDAILADPHYVYTVQRLFTFAAYWKVGVLVCSARALDSALSGRDALRGLPAVQHLPG